MWFIKREKRTVTISGGKNHAEPNCRLATFNGRSFDYVPFLDDEDRKTARDYMRKDWLENPHSYKELGVKNNDN